MRIVIVRDNIVENIGAPPLEGDPPAGTTAHEFNGFVSIGWEWNNGNPVDPNPPPAPEPTPTQTPKQKLEAALGMTIAEANALFAGGK